MALETPRITEHPLNMTVARNEPVTLSCKASGNPRPTIEWFRNGQLVKMAPEDPVSHRILLPDGSLFFLKAMQSKKEQDGGIYWCVASNEVGVARSNNATLEIACKYKFLSDSTPNAKCLSDSTPNSKWLTASKTKSLSMKMEQ